MSQDRIVEMPIEWGGTVPSRVFFEEAVMIVEEARKQELIMRVMGGVGIALRCPESKDLMRRLRRLEEEGQEFTDIDLMAYRKQRNQMKAFFEGIGYSKRRATLSTAASERQIYFHPKGWFLVDVFFDKLRVANHPLDFRDRLELDKLTLSPTDLLLEKLQIVHFSEKDLKDTVALLNAHDIGERDEKNLFNAGYIATLLSKDWGFWYTVTTNLTGIRDRTRTSSSLIHDEKERVISRAERLLAYINQETKTTTWKLRSIIGSRKKWYQPVETTETVGEFHVWKLREEAKNKK